jgi:hypothetical protein
VDSTATPRRGARPKITHPKRWAADGFCKQGALQGKTAPDPIRESSDPIRGRADPRVGIFDPRVGRVTNDHATLASRIAPERSSATWPAASKRPTIPPAEPSDVEMSASLAEKGKLCSRRVPARVTQGCQKSVRRTTYESWPASCFLGIIAARAGGGGSHETANRKKEKQPCALRFGRPRSSYFWQFFWLRDFCRPGPRSVTRRIRLQRPRRLKSRGSSVRYGTCLQVDG